MKKAWLPLLFPFQEGRKGCVEVASVDLTYVHPTPCAPGAPGQKVDMPVS